ncbi:hypothetical protein VPH35_072368 [Triticum aestivum]
MPSLPSFSSCAATHRSPDPHLPLVSTLALPSTEKERGAEPHARSRSSLRPPASSPARAFFPCCNRRDPAIVAPFCRCSAAAPPHLVSLASADHQGRNTDKQQLTRTRCPPLLPSLSFSLAHPRLTSLSLCLNQDPALPPHLLLRATSSWSSTTSLALDPACSRQPSCPSRGRTLHLRRISHRCKPPAPALLRLSGVEDASLLARIDRRQVRAADLCFPSRRVSISARSLARA